MKRSLFIVCLAALATVLFVSCTTTKIQDMRSVNVTGNGYVSLNADMANFSINVSEIAPTTGAAQQLTNKKMSQILEILRSFNIEDKDITTTSLNFSTAYYWDSTLQKQVKEGEEVSQTVYITMRDLDNFASLVDTLGANVTGISFYSTSFDASDKNKAYDEARTLAFEDAYNKAAKYAEAAGMKLGNPITISDGYVSTTTTRTNAGKMLYAESAAGDMVYQTETPSGTLSVSANVSVVFELVN